jgi:hypothetical protein
MKLMEDPRSRDGDSDECCRMKSYTAQYANNLTTVPRKAASKLKAHRGMIT